MDGEYNDKGDFRLNRQPRKEYTEAVAANTTSTRKALSREDYQKLNSVLREPEAPKVSRTNRLLIIKSESTVRTPVYDTVVKAAAHHNMLAIAINNVQRLLKGIIGVATKERKQVIMGGRDGANMKESIDQIASEPNPPTPQG